MPQIKAGDLPKASLIDKGKLSAVVVPIKPEPAPKLTNVPSIAPFLGKSPSNLFILII